MNRKLCQCGRVAAYETVVFTRSGRTLTNVCHTCLARAQADEICGGTRDPKEGL